MKQYVVERYTQSVKADLAARYGVRSEDLTDLSGVESCVFETILDGEDRCQ